MARKCRNQINYGSKPKVTNANKNQGGGGNKGAQTGGASKQQVRSMADTSAPTETAETAAPETSQQGNGEPSD
ncbi:hypothetical protein N0V85_009954 [Neurospora sp. IMI 360204]|nr:hypothetical protein N0V85_009954 [Neurospora sp. IMI 360204]